MLEKNKVDIGGLKIDAISKKQLLEAILARIHTQGQKTFITTPYSEFLYHSFRDPKLLDIFNQADFAVPDGIGIFWAKKYLEIPLTAKNFWAKILQAFWQLIYSLAAIIFNPSWIKSALPEKIVGADLVWDLAKLASENGLSVYLLGGFNDTAKTTAEKLKLDSINRGRDLSCLASNKNPDDASVIEDINKAAPDILMVAYGPVKQEKWIADNLVNLNVKVAVGVGGSFDYIAGVKSAPPKVIRYSGLEWLWRLVTQPQRWQRIINATFGLMSGLWHYKVFRSLPLRKNTAVVIVNQTKQILLCQRNPKDFHIDIITNRESLKNDIYWQFPQGGLDGNENAIQAAQREAQEETGIKNSTLIKVSAQNNTYIWNNALRGFWKNRNKPFIGQSQQIVYLKFSGQNSEIKVDQDEFINYKWVNLEDLLNTIHPERKALAEIVLKDLA